MTQIDSMNPKSGFLDIRFRGVAEGADFRTFMPQIEAELAHHHLDQLLLDFSEVVYQPMTLAEHAFAEYLAQSFHCIFKLAVILPRTLLPRETHFEITALNRGVCLHVYQSREEAEEWLKSAESKSEDPSLRL